jgi:hypothetical protein
MRIEHASRVAALRDSLRRARERQRRTVWPVDAPASERGDRVGIVVVNYNTRTLISQLVFSLYRVLGRDQFAELVIVDNASQDGSVEVLRALDDADLIHLIANRKQRYHGPGLNQGISWLARRQARVPPADRVDYVWVLDSDTVVLRRDAVRHALSSMVRTGAAAVGQSWGERPAHGPVALCSLMLDPRLVWQKAVEPFGDDGSPERQLFESASRVGLSAAAFPFLHDSYVLHLGSSSLFEVARQEERTNRHYAWTQGHPPGRTYAHHPLGPRLHATVTRAYEQEVPDGDAAALVRACTSDGLISVEDARPLPPVEELRELYFQGVDLERYVLEWHAQRPGARATD